MSQRFFFTLLAIASVFAAVGVPVAGQAPANTARASAAAAEGWNPPRTPDGQPNIQGLWTRRSGNFEREDSPNLNPLIVPRLSSLDEDRPNGLVAVYPNAYIGGGGPERTPEEKQRQQRAAEARKTLTLRTGIIDPPDGKVPPFRPEAEAARVKFYAHMPNPPTTEYIEWSARCGLEGVPQTVGPVRIVQRPNLLTMFYGDVLRTIPLDGRPHVGSKIRLYNGDSVGKWEGNTLVVDVTNFNGKTWWNRSMPMLSDQLHVVERYTPLNADTIDFEVTINDPGVWPRPVKVAGYYIRAEEDNFPLENSCAEGLQTIENVMTRPDGSRLNPKPLGIRP